MKSLLLLLMVIQLLLILRKNNTRNQVPPKTVHSTFWMQQESHVLYFSQNHKTQKKDCILRFFVDKFITQSQSLQGLPSTT